MNRRQRARQERSNARKHAPRAAAAAILSAPPASTLGGTSGISLSNPILS
ncbi:unnamed protein product [Ectocarpus sp. CCAP 1310/34]|nr:unnamed protein product [Ectocarpus sp. CCAP 1310/34]